MSDGAYQIGGVAMDDKEFSHDDLADWRAYEKVRKGGRFNMFDPRARRATGLSADRYLFVMEHYSELQVASRKEGA